MEGPDGQLQRFCQQCGRFHLLSAFDDNKRSCRERLARHNERRKRRIAAAASASKLSQASGTTSYSDGDHGSWAPPMQGEIWDLNAGQGIGQGTDTLEELHLRLQASRQAALLGSVGIPRLLAPSSSPAVLALPIEQQRVVLATDAMSEPQLGAMQAVAPQATSTLPALASQQFQALEHPHSLALPDSFPSGRTFFATSGVVDRRPASWPLPTLNISEAHGAASGSATALMPLHTVIMQPCDMEARPAAYLCSLTGATQDVSLTGTPATYVQLGSMISSQRLQGALSHPSLTLHTSLAGHLDAQMQDAGAGLGRPGIRVLGEHQTLDSIWQTLQLPNRDDSAAPRLSTPNSGLPHAQATATAPGAGGMVLQLQDIRFLGNP